MTKKSAKIKKTETIHRFIDEAGDCTFFGKGKVDIVGTNGVSNTFILGMVCVKDDLNVARNKILEKALEIEKNPYYSSIPSVKKSITKYGKFIFHAKNDVPEIRKEFFDLILQIDFSLEVMVARKIPSLFINKHNSKENEFYADLLSHLLKNKINSKKLVLNIAQKGSSTGGLNLKIALKKAEDRFLAKNTQAGKPFIYNAEALKKLDEHKVVFNVQSYQSDPLLALTDYGLWAVQRVFETGETRFYDYLIDKIKLVVDLYDYNDTSKPKWYNYYTKKNPLTPNNKISPSSS